MLVHCVYMDLARQKSLLTRLYVSQHMSAAQIAQKLGVSENKVHYWLRQHAVPKRSISEAVYARCNPKGDPFRIRPARSAEHHFLMGLGVGLYWGEGTKSSKNAVRLGNTDPSVIRCFVDFLVQHCGVDRRSLRFGLQIFSDMNSGEATAYWQALLNVAPTQFYKTIVTGARSIGTYRNKTKHGVLTVYFNNKHLRDYLCGLVADAPNMY